MKTWRAALLVCALWLGSVMVGHAQELRYLGPSPGTSNGWIELGAGGVYEVTVGTQIPGWGQVSKITPTHLVIRHRLSEAEQERLQSQGMATYDVLEVHIIRATPEAQPLPSPW
ncbi:MAG TPA: hypothetical protein VLG10_15755 [Methylomirabilota bacterium]|nr:hypothetical protein [Methylomirabilota bacterium]